MSSTEEEDSKTRKSLALDVRTYNMLQDICNHQERSKIGQLKVLIEKEYKFIFETCKIAFPHMSDILL